MEPALIMCLASLCTVVLVLILTLYNQRVILARLRGAQGPRGSDEQLTQSGHDCCLPAVVINPLDGLSFDDSLSPSKLSDTVNTNVTHALARQFPNEWASGVTSTVQLSALANGGLIVRFPGSAYKLMRSADGTRKAVVLGLSGKIRAIGNVDVTSTWVGRLAQSTALVTTVAHLISARDLSQRIGHSSFR